MTTTSLEGKDASLWVATTKQTNYPALTSDNTTYDLIVVGGGITGVAAAYEAQQRGLNTVLVEKDRLVEWTTGSTTAKLTSQHYLIYDYLIRRHGMEAAQAFANANERGIYKIEQLSKELGIDSDFSRRSAYVYTKDPAKTKDIEAEVTAAQQLDLPAGFETTTDLPFEVESAIKFADQAQFHPRKFLLGLVEAYVANGGVVYEHTKATDITPGDINTVITEQGNLKGRNILQASGMPFWRSEIFDGFMWEKASYALAVRLNDESAYPEGMYITTDSPMRTIRSAEYNGGQVLIYGGESHEYDEATFDPDAHYEVLIRDVRKDYDVDEVLFRWLASDNMPYDRMPYIGAMPGQQNIYTITGYRAWGLAWAMSATEAIVDEITGSPAKWARPFSLDRLNQPVRDEDKSNRF